MSDHLRPRFKYLVQESPQEIADQFKKSLADNPYDLRGTVLNYHIVVDFPKSVQEHWTPQMDISIMEEEEGTLVRGLIGPRPPVWTKFMFFYAVIGAIGIAGFIVGPVQWSMGKHPWLLWGIPISLVLGLVIFIIGRSGKNIAYPDSVILHKFLLEQLNDPKSVETDTL